MNQQRDETPDSPQNSPLDGLVAIFDKLRQVGWWAVAIAVIAVLAVLAEVANAVHPQVVALADSLPVGYPLVYTLAGIAAGSGILAVVLPRLFADSLYKRSVAAIAALIYALVVLIVVASTGTDWPLQLTLWAGGGVLALSAVMYRCRQEPIGQVVFGTLVLAAVVAVPLIELEERGVLQPDQSIGPMWFVLCTWVAVLLLATRTRIYDERRWIENTPRSTAQGAMVGDNELAGRARAYSPLTAPYSERDCIYHQSVLQEERERPVDDGDETEEFWVTIESETRRTPFELHDDTGSIHVDPTGATLRHTQQVVDEIFQSTDSRRGQHLGDGHREGTATGRRRRRESIIADDTELYVLGYAGIRDDGQGLEIADDEDARLFELSTKSRRAVIKDRSVSEGMLSVLAFLAFAAAPIVPIFSADEIFAGQPLLMALTMGIWLAVGLIWSAAGPLRTIYNGLVDLENRKARARSMLEVEYERRSSLIPALVELVETFASHEQQLHNQLAELRGSPYDDPTDQMEPRETADAIEDQTRRLKQLVALGEQTPELKSDDQYRKLMDELTRCEDKIALARTYYNDSIQRLNNRVETFPDLLVAPFAGVSSSDHLQIDEIQSTRIDAPARDDDRQHERRAEPAPHG